MSKTYTLTATVTCKKGTVRSATLANYTENYTSNTIIGSTGSTSQYACIFAFNSTTMAHLRGLASTAITSATLKISATTAASGAFHPYYGAKKNSGTSDAEISASNNIAVTKSSASVSINVKELGFPTTNAYCVGSQTNTSGETYATMRGLTATLTVVTTENDLTLSYNANGGSGAPSSQSATAVGSYSFTISSTAPTRSGYVFKGWATSSTATSAAYQPGGTISISSNTTLYAVWYKTLKLTYNANGGSGAPAVQSKDVYSSAAFTISATLPTRDGYTFLGWADSASATVAAYQPGGTITITANKTIYAVWQANGKLIIDGVAKNATIKSVIIGGVAKDVVGTKVLVGGVWK